MSKWAMWLRQWLWPVDDYTDEIAGMSTYELEDRE